MKASPTFSQWVLSLPFRVRYLLAYDPELLAGVRRIFARAVRSFLERRARDEGAPDGCSGAVVFVQRFDSGLRLNVHFHALFLDGVFVRPLFGEPRLHTVRPLRDEDVARLTKALRHRILRFLRRKGRLSGEDEPEPVPENEPLLAACYAAAVQGRVALGVSAGRPVTRIGSRPDPVPEIKPGTLCAPRRLLAARRRSRSSRSSPPSGAALPLRRSPWSDCR
ncbi:MAG: hypothetical protein ACE5F1_12840 [Planctomycetota bacterium]